MARMPDNRLPKKVLFSELQHGKCSLGGPKKRYKDTLKKPLKIPDTWEQAAHNRSEWRAALHNDAEIHEREKTIAAEKRQQVRKSNTDRCPSAVQVTSLCHANTNYITHM